MDRLDELSLLVAVIDAGGLAAAGRRLRRSPAAMTRALAALEERAGARLIERTTRRLAPTEAGRELAEHARRLLADYEAALETSAPSAVRGLLRVTGPTVFGGRHLVPVVNAFLSEHPAVRADVALHDRNLDLIESELHVALRIGALADSSLLARRVGSVRRVTVATPGYLARRGEPKAPADLVDHDTILTTVISASPEWRFEAAGRPRAVRLDPRLRVNNVEAALAAVLADQGIGRALSYQVADEIADGRLVRLLRGFEPSPLPVQLLTVGGRFMPPLVRAFLDYATPRLERLAVLREKPA
ncbi:MULTISPECIES: LysR family transcriptional regulator [unclassified Caulobacter]|uniref:LysR family transcriptional regulator n=1 Tax=unclassified Caulobacter TaxID=2648921 RepID=UPI0006FE21E5|nr:MULTISPECIES: LysR family transcriptional regulator [unclassified Caulobacter]KQV57803.1 transcriptional regulator [Caulobacter sp. Root342]KQV67375.1 transcriptional regulator [Caulobacter sp. Root343]